MGKERGTDIHGSAQKGPMSVLVVEAGERPAHAVARVLVEAGYRIADRVPAAADLAAAAGRVRPDAIVLCSPAEHPAPTADLLAKLATLKAAPPCPLVFATAGMTAATTRHAIDIGVSAFLIGDLDAERVRGVVDLAVARFTELDGLRRELRTARKKLAERKVIEKAKGLLMQRSGLDEDTAYRSLRKLAMDRNLTLVDVAENLLTVADVLDDRAVDASPPRESPASVELLTPGRAAPRAE